MYINTVLVALVILLPFFLFAGIGWNKLLISMHTWAKQALMENLHGVSDIVGSCQTDRFVPRQILQGRGYVRGLSICGIQKYIVKYIGTSIAYILRLPHPAEKHIFVFPHLTRVAAPSLSARIHVARNCSFFFLFSGNSAGFPPRIFYLINWVGNFLLLLFS